MIPFFSETGLQRLDDIVRPNLLCAFDFDGTLAPIVSQPDHAALPAEVLKGLKNLSQHATVALLTGRSVADIRARLKYEPDYVIGNHGCEGIPGWEAKGADYQQLCLAWKHRLLKAMQDEAYAGSGIWVEDKLYSLTVHYRMVPNVEQVKAKLRALFAKELPTARVVDGKCIFNLIPPGAPNKGDALARLIEISGARNAIYVGDDVTDEDAFRLHRPDLMTVRVEYLEGSAAEFFLPQWQDIVYLLDELNKRLCAMHAGGVRLV